MMKKLTILPLAAFVLLLMGSCGGGTQKVPFDNGDSANVANADPTLYGVCGEGTAMHTLQLITDTGDTLSIDLTDAQEKGRVFGGLHVGDRMAVLPSKDKTFALMAVNQSDLLGNWVMPNPIDGSDEVGISIKEGGIAESIQQPNLTYKTWKLTRGMLELVLVREGGTEEDEVCLYDLVKLSPDTLIFKDSEDTYEYSRQKPHEEYDLGGIELEDAGVEEFKP